MATVAGATFPTVAKGDKDGRPAQPPLLTEGASSRLAGELSPVRGERQDPSKSAGANPMAISCGALSSNGGKEAEDLLVELQRREAKLREEIERCLETEDYDGAQNFEDERKIVEAKLFRMQASKK